VYFCSALFVHSLSLDAHQVVSAHMQLTTSSAPFSGSATTQVGVRAPGNSGNTQKCGVSGGLMATASTVRLSVTQGTPIGGNINVVVAHINSSPLFSPSANITFSYTTGASPDFTSGDTALSQWPIIRASTPATWWIVCASRSESGCISSDMPHYVCAPSSTWPVHVMCVRVFLSVCLIFMSLWNSCGWSQPEYPSVGRCLDVDAGPRHDSNRHGGW
jgi:hypothetical protein